MNEISPSDAWASVAPYRLRQPLLEVASLTKSRSEQLALAGVAFSARAGEVLGLIGPNGFGKTTMLECLAGVLSADSGEVSSRGKALPASRRREAIFYVPDGVRPYEDQLVAQVLSFFADVYGRSESDVADSIAAVGLRPVLRKRVYSLSKGFGRCLMLALGLLAPHEVLLMEEPFDGFDLRQNREIVGAIRIEVGKGRSFGFLLQIMGSANRQ